MSKIRMISPLVAAAVCLFSPSLASADVYTLWDWTINTDGSTAYNPPAPPAYVTDNLTPTGLGTMSFHITTPGPHIFGLWVDYDGPDVFTDFGAVSAAPLPAGLTWELGSPGATFADFAAGNLQNTNDVATPNSPPLACCDVAMAMLYRFTLGAGEDADFGFTVGTTAPAGFYLSQGDLSSLDRIYLSFETGAAPPVPEPSAILLFGTTLLGAGWVVRRNRRART